MAGRHHVRVEVCAPGLRGTFLHRLYPDEALSGELDGRTFYISECGAWVAPVNPFRSLAGWTHCMACFPDLVAHLDRHNL